MPNNLDDLFECYGAYVTAKEQKDHLLWLKAIHCRKLLQNFAGDPDKEAEAFHRIFQGFVTKELIDKMYTELCNDSKKFAQ